MTVTHHLTSPIFILPRILSIILTLLGLGCEQTTPSSTAPDDHVLQLSTRQEKVVYGVDSRRDYYELNSIEDLKWRARARYSTGVLVRPSYISSQNGQVILNGTTLGESQGLCPDEKFYNQPEPGFCSGTLISEDLFLTAGHCIENATDCSNTMIAFQYIYTDAQTLNPLTQDDLYQCQNIVTRRNSNGYDYAIIRLDRTVASYLEPAPINFETYPVNIADQIILVGAPNGIPIKVDSEGQVTSLSNSNVTFEGSVDAFGGNSGSAIYNAAGEIVGILVQGRPDYEYDHRAGCRRVNQINVDGQGNPTDLNGAETAVYVGRAIDSLCNISPTHSICLQRDQGNEGGTSNAGDTGDTGGIEPPVLCEDDFEPDDSSTQANPIILGQVGAHTFCDDSIDWISFSPETAGLGIDIETYRIGILGAGDPTASFISLDSPLDAPAPNTEVTLYNGELLVMASDQNSGDGDLSALSGAVLPTRNPYFVRLRDLAELGNEDGYAVMVRAHCQEDEFESLPEPFTQYHDDYPSAILPVSPIPSSYLSSLCDEDWKRLEVTPELIAQQLSIHIETQVQEPTDTILTLYGPQGTELITNDDGPRLGLGSAIDWTPQEPGSYWIRVRGYQNSYGFSRPYTLQITTPEICDDLDNDQDGLVDEGLNGCLDCEPDAYENNDSPAEAVGVGIGYSIPLNHCLDAEDWFSFTLTNGQRVDIETTVTVPSDTFIELYNRQGIRVAENDDISPQNYGSAIKQFQATYTGGYWLRVSQFEQQIGPGTDYSLMIRNACADDTVEPDDQAYDAPLWTATSDTILVEERSLCDPDWIRFEAVAGQRFSFEISAVINASLTLTISREFGRIPLDSVSDVASEGNLSLVWEAPLTGTYWLSMTSSDGHYGGDAGYVLTGLLYPSEQCNEQDDDQDGEVDEGVSNACGTCGSLPQEICDATDNDCDGRIDEGQLNACGGCGPVPQESCDEEDNDCDGRVDEGSLNACGTCGEVPSEICDGLDNDCDDSIDEGVLNACGRCGLVPTEICDGVDNDCDGNSDEGIPVNACGFCGESPVESCDEVDNDCDGLVDEGLRNLCGTCGEAPIEACDGIDNDCDDIIDEGVLNACGACGTIPPELCDELYQGSDDDCDGIVDEGCPVRPSGGIEGGSAQIGSNGGDDTGGTTAEPSDQAGAVIVGGSEGIDVDLPSSEEDVFIDESNMHIEAGCQGSKVPLTPFESLFVLLFLLVLPQVKRFQKAS